MRPKLLTLIVLAAWLLQPAVSTAADPPSLLSDYRVTAWAGGDGITLGEVRSIAQDKDGYLWLASDAGLVRFDGIRFARSEIVAGDMPLPAAPTRAVYVARDGSLWVGYGERQGIYRIARGNVQDVHLKGRLSGLVNFITEDRDGTVWVGHDEGLQRYRAGRWEAVPLPPQRARRVLHVRQDRTGTIWVATTSGLFQSRPDGTFEQAPYGEGAARAVSEDAAGRVWVTDDRAGFRRADTPEQNRLFEARGMWVFHDSRDDFWLTTVGQGLWHVRRGPDGAAPSVQRVTTQTGLASDESSYIFEDRDGNIWVGSIQGLNRLTPYVVNSVVDVGVVRRLALGADGTAWVGTTTGLLGLEGFTGRVTGARRVVSRAGIRALHTARDGTVWAATDGGLHTVVGGRLAAVTASGPVLRQITSIASDDRGVLWLCDEKHGLMRLADGHLEAVPIAAQSGAEPALFTSVDDKGRVWIAYRGGVVRTLDREGRVAQYGRAEGLAHTVVLAMYHDSRGEVWVAGDRGLSRLRGTRFQTVTFDNDQPFRTVATVIEDDAGDLWVGIAFFGFVRVSREEVSRAMDDSRYRMRYRVYNVSSGAGFPDGAHNGASGRGRDNTLWFVTSRGVTVLDPGELRRRPAGMPGPPRIEGMTADSRRYLAGGDVTLEPRTSRLRIDYTAVSLSSLERVRFRYRLDGFDDTWVDGSGPRQADYTNLPPGDYRFRVQASTNAAAWNDAETDWAFSIQPMFYQTRWFYALCALAIALGAMGAWRLRVRHVKKEIATVFGERLRLSREIHDTLLQSLVGIALQLDSASHSVEAESPSRTRTQLVAMRRQVEHYIREVRQSIWDLRSPALDRHGLVGALRATGERLTDGKTRFALTVTGTPRSCPSRVETHVLRIGHEAVMNAVRHAQAREVQMEIAYEDDVLRLRVVDDGRGFGFGTGSPEPSHYGLISMKERAADAGGRCTIDSPPGAGVQVVAEFPLRPTG